MKPQTSRTRERKDRLLDIGLEQAHGIRRRNQRHAMALICKERRVSGMALCNGDAANFRTGREGEISKLHLIHPTIKKSQAIQISGFLSK